MTIPPPPDRFITVSVRTKARIAYRDSRAHIYSVPMNKLIATSAWLARAVQSKRAEGVVGVVWRDHTAFHAYILWLQDGIVRSGADVRKDVGQCSSAKKIRDKVTYANQDEEQFAMLLKLWNVGSFFEDLSFRNTILAKSEEMISKLAIDPYDLFEVLNLTVINDIWTTGSISTMQSVNLPMQNFLAKSIVTFASHRVLEHFTSPQYPQSFRLALQLYFRDTLPIHAVPDHWPPPEQYSTGLRSEVMIEDMRMKRIIPSDYAWAKLSPTVNSTERLMGKGQHENKNGKAANLGPRLQQLTGAEWTELAYWTVTKSADEANDDEGLVAIIELDRV